MKKEKEEGRSSNYSFIAIFYFILIFGITVYLFMTLFSKRIGSNTDSEMIIFNDSIFSESLGHNRIIMDFPKFAIKKLSR